MKIVDWLFLPLNYEPMPQSRYISLSFSENGGLKSITGLDNKGYFSLKDLPFPATNYIYTSEEDFFVNDKEYNLIEYTNTGVKYFVLKDGQKTDFLQAAYFDTDRNNKFIIQHGTIFLKEEPKKMSVFWLLFDEIKEERTYYYLEMSEASFPNLEKITFGKNLSICWGIDINNQNKQVSIADDWNIFINKASIKELNNCIISNSNISGVIQDEWNKDNNNFIPWLKWGSIYWTNLNGQWTSYISNYKIFNNHLHFNNQVEVKEKNLTITNTTATDTLEFESQLENRLCYVVAEWFGYSSGWIIIFWNWEMQTFEGLGYTMEVSCYSNNKIQFSIRKKSTSIAGNVTIRACII